MCVCSLDQLFPIGHRAGVIDLLSSAQVHTTAHYRVAREQHWALHLLSPVLVDVGRVAHLFNFLCCVNCLFYLSLSYEEPGWLSELGSCRAWVAQ